MLLVMSHVFSGNRQTTSAAERGEPPPQGFGLIGAFARRIRSEECPGIWSPSCGDRNCLQGPTVPTTVIQYPRSLQAGDVAPLGGGGAGKTAHQFGVRWEDAEKERLKQPSFRRTNRDPGLGPCACLAGGLQIGIA